MGIFETFQGKLEEARSAGAASNSPQNLPEPGTSKPKNGPIPADDKSPLASKLERLSEKALAKSDQILDMAPEIDDANFGTVLRAQTAVINSTLTTQARTDETRLRAQAVDRLDEICRVIQEEEKKLPPRLIRSIDLLDGGDGENAPP